MNKPHPHVYQHTGPDMPKHEDHVAMHREMTAPMRQPPRHDGEAYHGQAPPVPSSGLGGGMGGAGASVPGLGD